MLPIAVEDAGSSDGLIRLLIQYCVSHFDKVTAGLMKNMSNGYAKQSRFHAHVD